MKRVIKNVMVVTPEVDCELIRNGYIEISDNIITAIGDMKAIPAYGKDVEMYDGKNRIAIPGFVCAHNHMYSAVVRGWSGSGSRSLKIK
jgi:cytosine/adenosine deaminase-related metal-dependent hydrolase